MLIRDSEPENLGKPDFTAEFCSTVGEKNRILGQLIDELKKEDCVGEDDLFSTRLALDEGLVNAIKHGNGYDQEKKVKVSLFMAGNEWSVCIEDEGNGFFEEDIPSLDDDESLLLNHGRGVNLMKHFMDEVTYYCNGRVLVLRKKCNS